jgi:alpha/beta superfamily hydrolase
MPLWCPPDAVTAETVRFPAGASRLEGELAYPDGPAAGAVLIAGPHPLLGGNRDNNVVRGLADSLARGGLVTLRFDYQGVGCSEGPGGDVAAHLAAFWQTSRAPDEPRFRDDLAAALAFLRDAAPGLPVALAGYSFGCSLLSGVLPPDDALTPLVLVAPTLGSHDYAPYERLPNPKLVIAPDGDFAADARCLERWFGLLPGSKQLLRPRQDGHFFRGHEDWLAATVATFLDDFPR